MSERWKCVGHFLCILSSFLPYTSFKKKQKTPRLCCSIFPVVLVHFLKDFPHLFLEMENKGRAECQASKQTPMRWEIFGYVLCIHLDSCSSYLSCWPGWNRQIDEDKHFFFFPTTPSSSFLWEFQSDKESQPWFTDEQNDHICLVSQWRLIGALESRKFHKADDRLGVMNQCAEG